MTKKEKIIAAKDSGKLVLITSHLLSELEGIVSHVIFMQEGSVLLHEDVAELKRVTGQATIAKSIIYLLKKEEQ